MYWLKWMLSQYYYIHLVSLLILQHILIPCFQHPFEENEVEKLIGEPPTPDQDNPRTPRTSSAPSSPKSSSLRTRLGPRTLSGSSCCSYPLSWWSRPRLISTTPTTSRLWQRVFMLSSCWCCQKVHFYMSCQQVVKLSSCSDCQIVHVIEISYGVHISL